MKANWLGIFLSGVLVACGSPDQAQDAGDPADTAGGSEPTAEEPAPDLDSLLASADVERGQRLFLQCRACHSLNEEGDHKVGPNLYGMFGQQAAQAPGFNYSEALASANLTWSPETMNEWLARPSTYVKGTTMVFIGIKDPQDRASLIAYLQRETGATQ